MFHALGPLTYTNSELIPETMNTFVHFGCVPWTEDWHISRPIPIQENTAQKKRRNISMPQAGFEPTMPVFKWSDILRALDSAATRTSKFTGCSAIWWTASLSAQRCRNIRAL